ncbi:MAG: hypothetical protein HQ472_02450 [Ignavibacteria bacterium]|nr:hypothetical protein [Ignavibacteria bacterium]
MKNKSIISVAVVSLVLISVLASCDSIRNITNSLTSLKNMEFKLNNISNMKLAGVDISRLSDPSKLSISDGLSLTAAFARRSLPATLTLNVDAKNPNASSGSKAGTALTLNGLDWRLLIDDKPTINGDLASPVDIAAVATPTNIPLAMSLDLYSFFAGKGYDGILNLALALGGVNGSAARVKLDAMPSVGTPFGTMKYPNRITIINTEFRAQ